MTDCTVKTAPRVAMERPSSMELEEGVLLAAALAATLVEYRYRIAQHQGHGNANVVGVNWRTIGRWEQLRA